MADENTKLFSETAKALKNTNRTLKEITSAGIEREKQATDALKKRAEASVLNKNELNALKKQNAEAAKKAEDGDKKLIEAAQKSQNKLDDALKAIADKKTAEDSLKLQKERTELARKASGFSEKRFRKIEIANAAVEEQKKYMEESSKALGELGIDAKGSKKHREEQKKQAQLELNLAKATGSKDAEEDAKKKLRDLRGNTLLGKMANTITDIGKSAKDKIKAGGKGILDLLGKFAFGAFVVGVIAFLNSPYFDKMVKVFKEDIIPFLTFLVDDVLLPFGRFIRDIIMPVIRVIVGAFNYVEEKTKGLVEGSKIPFLETAVDGLFTGIKVIAGGLALAALFKPFKVIGGIAKLGVFLTKSIAGFAAKLLGMSKGVDAAAKTAGVVSKTAGVATAATKGAAGAAGAVSSAGKYVPKGGAAAITARATSNVTASSMTNQVKDKFSHLKKFPKLLKAAKFIPLLGPLLTGGMAVAILLSDAPKEEKIKKMGGLIGGGLGSAGFGVVGAALGSAFPGPGTIAGGVIGSLVGFFGGEYAGTKLAEFLMAGKEPKLETGAAGDMDAMVEQGAGADIPKAKKPFNRSIRSKMARADRLRSGARGEKTLSYTPNPNKDASRISPDPFAKLQQSPAPSIVNAPTNVNAPSTTNMSSAATSLTNTDRVLDKLNYVV